MELRKGYIGNEALETIYFGGGTPSQLDEKDFGKIFEAIYRLFDVAEQAEITLEANPDDMKREYVSLLRNYPFNRVSMGVQSFHPEDLRFLNRRHDREQAIKAVELCKEYGITNISIDLIYGLPNQTKQAWEENLRQAIRLDVHKVYGRGAVDNPFTMPKPMAVPAMARKRNNTKKALKMLKNSFEVYLADLTGEPKPALQTHVFRNS